MDDNDNIFWFLVGYVASGKRIADGPRERWDTLSFAAIVIFLSVAIVVALI